MTRPVEAGSPRRAARRPSLRWLYVQVVLLHAAYAAVRPMASYRALDMDAGGAQLGLLAASFATLPLFLAFVAGRQADRLGPGRLLLAGSVLLVLSSVAALLAGNFVLLLLACAALGFGQLLAMIGQQATIATRTSASERDRGFGWLTASASLGQMVGPAVALSLAGALATESTSAGVIGLGAAAAIAGLAVPFAVPFGWRRPSRPAAVAPAEGTTTFGALSLLVRTPGMWRAMVTSGTVLAAIDLLMAFLPAWAEDRGIPVATVGWLLALRALVSMASRLALVRLIAAVTRRWAFVGSLVLGVVGLAALPFVGVGGAVVVMFLLGAGLGLAQPLTLSWVSTLASPQMRGAAIGLRLTGNRLAQTVLPPAIGLVAVGSGSTGVFLASAVMLAVATPTVVGKGLLDPARPAGAGEQGESRHPAGEDPA